MVKFLVKFPILLGVRRHQSLKAQTIEGKTVKRERLDMVIHVGLRCITVKYGLAGENSEMEIEEIDYPSDE